MAAPTQLACEFCSLFFFFSSFVRRMLTIQSERSRELAFLMRPLFMSRCRGLRGTIICSSYRWWTVLICEDLRETSVVQLILRPAGIMHGHLLKSEQLKPT